MHTPAELRLLDANANRAREGIRTAEEFLRFSGTGTAWVRTLKEKRHGITTLVHACFPAQGLIAARQVEQDPERPAQSGPAHTKNSAQGGIEIARRGLKRAQEAVRVLEEFARDVDAERAGALSRIRYTLYEAEQWLALTHPKAVLLSGNQVYVLLTAALCRHGLLDTAERVIRGGVRVLQWREKNQTDCVSLSQARDLQRLCFQNGAVLICNDRPDLALATGAAGVHVGQDDLPPEDVRKVAGQRLLIGRSTHSVEQAQRAVAEGVDYLAIGSMYDTSTKVGRILVGVELARRVKETEIGIPVYAIGGITLDRVAELKAAGVQRVAVSSAVIAHTDPEDAARRFVAAMAE